MKKQLATSGLASALMAAMVSSALGYSGPGTLGNQETDRKFDAIVEWFTKHPSEFRTFLQAIRDGNSECCDSILKLTGLSSEELLQLGSEAHGYIPADRFTPAPGVQIARGKRRRNPLFSPSPQ